MTPKEASAYEQGFMDKCAEYGVDPGLVKEAARGDMLGKLLTSIDNLPGGALLHTEPVEIAEKIRTMFRNLRPEVMAPASTRMKSTMDVVRRGVRQDIPMVRGLREFVDYLKPIAKGSDVLGKLGVK